MNARTDLISEENLAGNSKIKTEKSCAEGVYTEITEINDENAAKAFKKPCGKYCTIRFDRLDTLPDTTPLQSALISALKKLTGGIDDNALIVGLGNADITPDALGPLSAGSVIATRHISRELKKTLGIEGLHKVSCLVPGVLGKTGIEAVDIIKAAVEKIRPDIVIAIDALAARTPENLCRTIQLTDSGIAPGSGVKNERRALNRDNLGVPVIALGIPTVIDAECFLAGQKSTENMMVTPKEIDLLISRSAAVIARAVNMFFQPSLDEATIESLS
ncbi:MAG: GPR endopeptidase [Clostridia bacterium]|nr:GPR endopeptidase [Clostridia bacterium]